MTNPAPDNAPEAVRALAEALVNQRFDDIGYQIAFSRDHVKLLLIDAILDTSVDADLNRVLRLCKVIIRHGAKPQTDDVLEDTADAWQEMADHAHDVSVGAGIEAVRRREGHGEEAGAL